MTQHTHTTTAHPAYCPIHDRDYYPRTCGHGTGCPECDLEAAVEAARQALPESVNGRLAKAAELVRAGKVHVANGVAVVESQNGNGKYTVNGRCNCPDAKYQAPHFGGRPACKHQLAVWLEKKMQEPRAIEAPAVVSSEIVPGSLAHKRYQAHCHVCQRETAHGLGIGCLRCHDRHLLEVA